MATKGNTRLDKISTREILKELEEAKDNTEFFYLYVSTAGEERKKQTRQLPTGQLRLTFTTEDEDSDDTQSEEEGEDEQMEDDNADTTENISQPPSSPLGEDNTVNSNNPPPSLPLPEDDQNNPPSSSSSLSKDKPRNEAMNKVHKVVLPKILGPDGWKKVHDKDMKLTYKALYFNRIKKYQSEDDTTYVQRVAAIRKKIADEADKLKEEHHANFKINSLLSKPFLYDELALAEQTMKEGSTQKQQLKQTDLNKYITKK